MVDKIYKKNLLPRTLGILRRETTEENKINLR